MTVAMLEEVIRVEPPTRRGNRHLLRARGCLAPGCLMLAAGIVLYLHQHPPVPSDQLTYFRWAELWPDLNSDNHLSHRIGLLLPVRGFQALFGYSEVAYFAVPMIAGIALVVATYAVGTLLHSRRVGIAAAGLLLTSPVFLDEAGELLPDIPAVAVFTIAVALLLRDASKSEREKAATGPTSLLLAGTLLGVAYLIREFIILAFFVVPLVFLLYRMPWRRLVYVMIPVVLVGLVEVVLSWTLYGEPFARVAAYATHGHSAQSQARAAEQGLTRAKVALRFPEELLQRFPSATLFLALVLVFLVVALWTRRRGLIVAASWCLGFWFLLSLFGGLWDPGTPMISTNKPRYWMVTLPPLFVGVAATLWILADQVAMQLTSRRSSRPPREGTTPTTLFTASVCAVLIGGIAFVGWSDSADLGTARMNGGFEDVVAFRGWITDHGREVDTVWSDGDTSRVLRVYVRTPWGRPIFDGAVRRFEHGAEFENLHKIRPGDIVVIRNQRLQQLVDALGDDVPDVFFHPNRYGWQRVFATDQNHLKIFAVQESDDPSA